MFKFNFALGDGDEMASAAPTFEAVTTTAAAAGDEEIPVNTANPEISPSGVAAAEIVDEREAGGLQAAICDEDLLELGEVRLLRPVFSTELFTLGVEEHSYDADTERERSVALAAAVNESRDVLPGVYEGGFKLWECSVDLLHYLHDAVVPLAGKKVAEYGCGMGMPGLFALLSGASHVHLQDYNKEVLLYLTIPAVKSNVAAQAEAGKEVTGTVEYMAGDWTLVQENLEEREQQYDVILTTDTLYCTTAHAALCSLIKATLAPGGAAYVAAKSYYFGVGGSVYEFQELATREGFDVTRVKTIGDKKSNVREIIKLVARA